MADQSFQDEYFALLKNHFEQPSETHLLAAAELGKTLLRCDIPTETVAELHQQALHRLVTSFPETTLIESVQLVSEPLMELLMAYGLAFREREARRQREITERKRAEKKLRFTQFAVDHAAESIYWMTPDARFFYVNNAACRALGYSREELLSMSVHDIDPDYPAEAWQDLWKEIKEQREMTFEAHHRTKDDRVFPVEIQASYIEFEGQEYNCAFVRDITERKRAEEELRQHQDTLAHMCRLSAMGEMATGLAHELNQPLAAISNYCYAGQQALADSGSANPQQLRELFEKLTGQAMRAGEIIRRLRDLVNKRTPVRSSVYAVEPIQEVLRLLESDLRQSEVHVEQPEDHSGHVVMIDEIQIQQVLVNLFRNALDAMSETEHDQRRLKITTSRTADNLIKVSVSDTGEGIPVESADQVFEAFFSSKSEGMGMGLAISRSIIESHGGRLWMTPNSDRGVTFHFTLPIAKNRSDDDGG